MSRSDGDIVGYAVRFDNNYDVSTRVLFMTHGYLLKMLQ